MTTPTAMTIFQWLYVSSGLAPILEKRSEPLQKRIAIRERRNQFIFCCHPFLSFSIHWEGCPPEAACGEIGYCASTGYV